MPDHATSAEQPRPQPDLGLPTFMIYPALRSPELRQALTITPQQSADLENLWRTVFMQAMQTTALARTRGQAPGTAQREAMFAENQSTWEARVKTILTPTQLYRLRQIELQASGLFACENPHVARALGLSPNQVEAIASATRTYRERIQPYAAIQQARAKRIGSIGKEKRRVTAEEIRALMALNADERASVAGARTTAMQAIENTLTPEQRRTFDELLGERVDTRVLMSGSQGP